MSRMNWDRVERRRKMSRKRNNFYVAGQRPRRPPPVGGRRSGPWGAGRTSSVRISPEVEAALAASTSGEAAVAAREEQAEREAKYDRGLFDLIGLGYNEEWLRMMGMDWVIARADELQVLLPEAKRTSLDLEQDLQGEGSFDPDELRNLSYGELVDRLDDLVGKVEDQNQRVGEHDPHLDAEREAINKRLIELRQERKKTRA